MKLFHLYFASCVSDGGVYHYIWDGVHLQAVGCYPCDCPMYLEVIGKKLNVLLRSPFAESDESALLECALDSSGNPYPVSNLISTKGVVACHLCSFSEETYVTNYLSGSIFCTSGLLDVHTGCGPNLIRQDAAHTHYIAPSPDGKYLLSTDLGMDAVYIYDKALHVINVAHVPAGHGARHLAYSEDGRFVFCANELASTVTVFHYENSTLTPLQTVSVFFKKKDSAVAAIRVVGAYVYVSNRGDDSISCMKWDGKKLKLLSVTHCGGMSPRDFLIVDKTLICTNEQSNLITFFSVKGEQLSKLDVSLQIKKPFCVLATPENR